MFSHAKSTSLIETSFSSEVLDQVLARRQECVHIQDIIKQESTDQLADGLNFMGLILFLFYLQLHMKICS